MFEPRPEIENDGSHPGAHSLSLPWVKTHRPSEDTSRPIKTGDRPASASAPLASSSRSAETKAAIPKPQLNVRSISASSTPPSTRARKRQPAGEKASRSSETARRSSSTRGRLSGYPPPVIWAKAQYPSRSASAPEASGGHRGASVSAALPQASAKGRTARERPRRGRIGQRSGAPTKIRWNERRTKAARTQASPAVSPARGRRVPRSAAPTAKPARSKSPGA